MHHSISNIHEGMFFLGNNSCVFVMRNLRKHVTNLPRSLVRFSLLRRNHLKLMLCIISLKYRSSHFQCNDTIQASGLAK